MNAKLTKISEYVWELPTTYKKGMRIPIRVVASEKLASRMEATIFEQSSNVACLPGLVGYVIILPDAHSGYGAPIGCVFASDFEKGGIISPGAVGFDINCGMRLLTTNLKIGEVRPQLSKLINLLFDCVPPGVGRQGFLKISPKELDLVLTGGAEYIVSKGYGWEEDLFHTEEKGKLEGADPGKVSKRAKERGIRQLATLGSGNHYLEIQKIEKIYNEEIAKKYGILETNQVVIMFHCGSRGLGHQVASDYLKIHEAKLGKYGIEVSDRQLACAPFISSDGQDYYQAMAGAVNFAFANRQAITFRIRQVFEKVFSKSAENLGLKLVYDVAHNIAKKEKHQLPTTDSRQAVTKSLIVHRKGATRSFPNAPVIIGGSMETGSYLLVGEEKSLFLCFGSTAHGSGRTMSRGRARKIVRGKDISQKMASEGIVVKSASWAGLAEEAGIAYKDIGDVVESVFKAGIASPIASFRPIGNIKG